jgi:hypothetical protein
MLTEKRRRGRPLGSGKDDSAALAQVADLLVRDSSLLPTRAMQRVLRSRNDWGATDVTLVRRWQGKWKRDRHSHMAGARERARPKPTRHIFGNTTTNAWLEYQNSTAVKAMQKLCAPFESPKMKAALEFFRQMNEAEAALRRARFR